MTIDVPPPSNPTSPTPEAALPTQPTQQLPPYFDVLHAADRSQYPTNPPFFYLLRRYNISHLSDSPPAISLYQISLYRVAASDFDGLQPGEMPAPRYVGTVHWFHDEVQDSWFECRGDYDLVDEEEWDRRDEAMREEVRREGGAELGQLGEVMSQRPVREDETVWVDYGGFARRVQEGSE